MVEAPRPVSLRTSFRRSKRSGEVSPDKLTMLLSTFATSSLHEIYGAIRPNKKASAPSCSELLTVLVFRMCYATGWVVKAPIALTTALVNLGQKYNLRDKLITHAVE